VVYSVGVVLVFVLIRVNYLIVIGEREREEGFIMFFLFRVLDSLSIYSQQPFPHFTFFCFFDILEFAFGFFPLPLVS